MIKKKCVWYIIISIACSILLAGSVCGSKSEGLVFISDCNDYTRYISYCENVTYQFTAIDTLKKNHNNRRIRYRLLEGPGEINNKTGLWSWEASEADSAGYYDVTVEAYIGNPHNDSLKESIICFRRYLKDRNRSPRLYIDSTDGGVPIFFTVPGEFTLPVYEVDPDPCDSIQQYVLDSVVPELKGSIVYENFDLQIALTPDDIEKRFTLFFSLGDIPYYSTRRFILDTRSNPTPEFTFCPDTSFIATPCEMLGKYVQATDPDFPDDHRLIIHEIISGPGAISRYGHYTFIPHQKDTGRTFTVEVTARYGELVSQQNCTFEVFVEPYQPGIRFLHEKEPISCGDTIKLSSEYSGRNLVLAAYGNNNCAQLPIVIDSVDPEPLGSYELEFSPGIGYHLFSYRYELEDGGKTVTFRLGWSEGNETRYCEIHFYHDWQYVEPEPYLLEITSDEAVVQWQLFSPEIQLTGGNIPIGGFDLLVAYDNGAFVFYSADAGDLLYDCNWEYFTYRYGDDGSCDNNCPVGLLRIIAIAETNNGPVHPSCYFPDDLPTSLVKLNFLCTNDRTYEYTLSHLRFFWLDCGDNTLATQSGDSLFTVSEIWDPFYVGHGYYDFENIYDSTSLFPTYTGGNDSICAQSNNAKGPYRFMELVNGYYRIGGDPLKDGNGDLNLNEIPYEIADAELFVQYFMHGESVFTINTEGQIAASDVNYDDIPLTVADLMHLRSRFFNEVMPYYALEHDKDTVTYYRIFEGASPLSVNSPSPLGAVYLTVPGDVTPILLQAEMSMVYNFRDSITHILIYSYGVKKIQNGEILTNIPEEILYFEASTFYGARTVGKYDLLLDASDPAQLNVPTSFALGQNYPNPFNNRTSFNFDVPKNSEIRIEIINLLGQKVLEHNQLYSPGSYRFEWDGQSSDGKDVASGIYYYRLISTEYTTTKKMLFLK